MTSTYKPFQPDFWNFLQLKKKKKHPAAYCYDTWYYLWVFIKKKKEGVRRKYTVLSGLYLPSPPSLFPLSIEEFNFKW